MNELVLIGCCIVDNELIDKAVIAGIQPTYFTEPSRQQLWTTMLRLKLVGKPVDITGLTLEKCNINDILAAEKSCAGMTTYFHDALDAVVWAYTSTMMRHITTDLNEQLKGYPDRKDVAMRVESLNKAFTLKTTAGRTNEDIGKEVEEQAIAAIENRPDPRTIIEWPIEIMNRMFGPIYPHEFVCLGARPKEGKSSLALQLVGHNLKLGRRGVYFTLETADTAALAQASAQMADINLRLLSKEPKDKQENYLKFVRKFRNSKNFRFLDRDMSIDRIESQCRLLKSSLVPEFVVIDHLHLITNEKGTSQYEKITDIANRMIELRKYMQCPVILALQLNRANAREARAPRSSDARDSGAIEAAAHRMLLIHRPDEDFNGQKQMGPDVSPRNVYDCYIMQDLCRDGPTGSIRSKFHAPHSKFLEA